jgi:hypothetical protein
MESLNIRLHPEYFLLLFSVSKSHYNPPANTTTITAITIIIASCC